ncbi:MAG: hypothetical protein KO316_00010 [Methanobacterium sp.]|nr:hypothetical protein [Methanobacterium sp.]
MREDIKGKATVALVVSLLAFGCGTGASIFSGFDIFPSTDNSSFSLNTSTDLPIIYNVEDSNTTNTTPATNTETTVQTSSSSSQDVYEENTQSNPSQPQPSTNTTTNNSADN